jgi:hypothetical protein
VEIHEKGETMKEIKGKMVASSLEEVLDSKHTALIVADPQNDFFADCRQ